MPVWHARTKGARQAGQLQVVGIIQEQHPDRCRLYAQWQQFDWPILHDPINAIGARAVPMFVAIDEAGIVVDSVLSLDRLDAFLSRPPATAESAVGIRPPSREQLYAQGEAMWDSAAAKKSAEAWMQAGDALLLWGKPADLDRAWVAYQRGLELAPDHAPLQFRLGVAHRMRFDLLDDPDAFAQAAAAWNRALELDPNHYIYRRRIQQYGPRLMKPYPFYDWIQQARAEIRARGETPVPLVAEPTGAEVASPQTSWTAAPAARENPDPQGRIDRDGGTLVQARVVVVPATIPPGSTTRIHVILRPKAGVFWNNEVDPPVVWIDLPAGWEATEIETSTPVPSQAETREVRSYDFELKTPPAATDRTLSGFALIYICENRGGQCLFRRIDFEIPLRFVTAEK
ncbi:MAG: hypothetical protein D6753_03945 [Planctomycetota bacterium]|nr:MAG: hypothetical protein D6753_03945 [Planctomycetota bacterium]